MTRQLAGFPVASPESAGLDRRLLAEFRKALRCETHELKSLAGAAHLVIHAGRCVFACSGGAADAERGTRFSSGTLCRLHGATKPLVAAAFLTLVDAGKCRLADPVSKYLPFADHVAISASHPRSARTLAAPAPRSSRAKAAGRLAKGPKLSSLKLAKVPVPATLRDLLTNTAGLADYDEPRNNARVLRSLRRRSIKDLKGLCDAIALEPLRSRPGKRYAYSFALDILGRVCEVVSGKPLDRFMEEALLWPLGMRDTHFRVPPRKQRRAAAMYNAQCRRRARRAEAGPAYSLVPYRHPHEAPGVLSAGGGILSYRDAGLWSTARDYARFCQMLLEGGLAPGGRRVLRGATARGLWADALAGLGRGARVPGWHDQDGPRRGGWWDYRGLSLLHAYLDLDEPPSCGGRPRRSRSMWFSGGGGVFWTVDGKRKLITVSFSQTFGGREDETDGHGPLAYRVAPYVQ